MYVSLAPSQSRCQERIRYERNLMRKVRKELGRPGEPSDRSKSDPWDGEGKEERLGRKTQLAVQI